MWHLALTLQKSGRQEGAPAGRSHQVGQGVPGRGRVSAMGLCRGAHMMKIFTRLSWLQAQERLEP